VILSNEEHGGRPMIMGSSSSSELSLRVPDRGAGSWMNGLEGVGRRERPLMKGGHVRPSPLLLDRLPLREPQRYGRAGNLRACFRAGFRACFNQ